MSYELRFHKLALDEWHKNELDSNTRHLSQDKDLNTLVVRMSAFGIRGWKMRLLIDTQIFIWAVIDSNKLNCQTRQVSAKELCLILRMTL